MQLPTAIPYKKLLVPHDGSEMSDRALTHAAYLANLSDAELAIIHVLEPELIPPSALLDFIKPETGGGLEAAKENLRNTLESGAAEMLKERIKAANIAEATKVSYIIKTGKPVDEIVNESESGNYDVVVMASSRIASRVRVLGVMQDGC